MTTQAMTGQRFTVSDIEQLLANINALTPSFLLFAEQVTAPAWARSIVADYQKSERRWFAQEEYKEALQKHFLTLHLPMTADTVEIYENIQLAESPKDLHDSVETLVHMLAVRVGVADDNSRAIGSMLKDGLPDFSYLDFSTFILWVEDYIDQSSHEFELAQGLHELGIDTPIEIRTFATSRKSSRIHQIIITRTPEQEKVAQTKAGEQDAEKSVGAKSEQEPQRAVQDTKEGTLEKTPLDMKVRSKTETKSSAVVDRTVDAYIAFSFGIIFLVMAIASFFASARSAMKELIVETLQMALNIHMFMKHRLYGEELEYPILPPFESNPWLYTISWLFIVCLLPIMLTTRPFGKDKDEEGA